jgi:DNA polymerase-3 subunit delta'
MTEAASASDTTPRSNPDLVEQGPAEAAFLAAWHSGRVPHAWLISGPRGVGKATLAFRIARFVLAGGVAETPSLEPGLAIAPDHPTFRRVAAGSHGDLMVLQPGMIHPDTRRETQEIVIGHVRAIVDFLTRTSAEGGWRVAIVDNAETMNRNAANALLKILEEPPARCLLLLTSSVPGALLPTIRSRCRQLKLPPLAPDAVARLLARFRPGSDAKALAALAEGSIGRALEIADLGGAALDARIDALLERLPALDVPDVHGFAEVMARPPKGAPEGGFALALELLARRAAERARRPGAAVESWLAVWDKIAELKNRADAVYLDRKLVLIEAFLALAGAARAGRAIVPNARPPNARSPNAGR